MAKPGQKPVAAISGLGFSTLSRKPAGTTRELAAVAIEAAINDAGLKKTAIDGLLINRSPLSTSEELPLRLQNDLGLHDLSLLAHVDSEGSSAVQIIQYAALAIAQGLANHVVCVFADSPVKPQGGGESFAIGLPISGIDGWEDQQGFVSAIAAYALVAQRHMTTYGTREEDLGAYAMSCREWAMRSPQAFLKKPLTLTDYLASPHIVWPFRVLDCAFPVNGAIAVIVTSVAEAQSGPNPPVYIHGMGQGHKGRSGLRGDDLVITSGAALAAERAYRSAGVTANQITACEFYDAFSFSGIMSLEEYGFCQRGEAAAFIAAGHTRPGGKLPVNTGGGHLSGFYLQGMTPVAEGIIQVRGTGEGRQVERNDLILVTGSGGCFDYHACLLLSPHASLS